MSNPVADDGAFATPVFQSAADEEDEKETIPYQWPLTATPPPASSSRQGTKRKLVFESVFATLPQRNKADYEKLKKHAKHLPPMHTGPIPPGTYILD